MTLCVLAGCHERGIQHWVRRAWSQDMGPCNRRKSMPARWHNQHPADSHEGALVVLAIADKERETNYYALPTHMGGKGLTSDASNPIWISSVPWEAGANSPVVTRSAKCILSAIARINALLLPACQGWQAVRVSETLVRVAADLGVALVVLFAKAASLVVPGSAECIYTALLEVASWLAEPVDAHLRVAAFRVALAPSYERE